MKTPLWIIDHLLTDGNEQKLEKALLKNNTEFIKTKYVPFSGTNKDLDNIVPNSNIVLYGTVEFINQCNKLITGTPGAFLNKNQLMFSHYACYYFDHLMNKDFEILPFGLIKKAWKENEPYSCGVPTFIRPNVVTKIFAGQTFVTVEDLENINKLEIVADETLCIIASNKKILEETRFLVVNKKVITGSIYKQFGKIYIKGDYSESAKNYLQSILDNTNWVPDTVFIADIALFQDMNDCGYRPEEYGIIEFNSFSCAGLYDMNLDDVVKSVNEAALQEYYSLTD